MDKGFLHTAVEAARAGGAVLRRWLGEVDVEYKSSSTDLVTQADRAAEAAIVDVLRRAYPEHGILAEEGGDTAGAGCYRWVIDPLDGTTNFAHGLPLFCVSVALEEVAGPGARELVAGVIYHPLMDELYTAQRGGGAFLNGRSLRVAPTAALERSLLVTGFPYDRGQCGPVVFDQFSRLTLLTRGVRRLGSAALDLAYVAAGRLDGFWESQLEPWDVAAGVLLVQEAGGRVSTLQGAPYRLGGTQGLVATNGRLHAALLDELQDCAAASQTSGHSDSQATS